MEIQINYPNIINNINIFIISLPNTIYTTFSNYISIYSRNNIRDQRFFLIILVYIFNKISLIL